MILPREEMLRAVQIYLDSIYKVPVEAVGVKEIRSNKKERRFEIKLQSRAGVVLEEYNPKQLDTIANEKPQINHMRTLEEIRAGNNTNAGT